MTLLSDADLEQIKSDIQDIVRDTSVNTTIKYRQNTGMGSYSVEQQDVAGIYTDWSGTSALKGMFTEEEKKSGIEMGDVKFIIMKSAVSNTLSTKDVIVESGTSYNVKYIKSDPLDLVYIIGASAV